VTGSGVTKVDKFQAAAAANAAVILSPHVAESCSRRAAKCAVDSSSRFTPAEMAIRFR